MLNLYWCAFYLLCAFYIYYRFGKHSKAGYRPCHALQMETFNSKAHYCSLVKSPSCHGYEVHGGQYQLPKLLNSKLHIHGKEKVKIILNFITYDGQLY